MLAAAQLPGNIRISEPQTTPAPRRVEPPPRDASPQVLEVRGDELREEKDYIDAIDYFRAAIKKEPKAVLYNKLGICELQIARERDAQKDFEKARKIQKDYAEAWNNLGVAFYMQKKYGKAIKNYAKAIELQPYSASFHSNLGTAYFSKKEFQSASVEYQKALQLDPDIFERMGRTGVAARMSSPEDRAHFSYVVARMYAQTGNYDRSLQFLRRAMEDGYKDLKDVYNDEEFAGLRKDPRFAELMNSKVNVIPE
jgi:tetratricopeptide (TPR) repeat protein